MTNACVFKRSKVHSLRAIRTSTVGHLKYAFWIVWKVLDDLRLVNKLLKRSRKDRAASRMLFHPLRRLACDH